MTGDDRAVAPTRADYRAELAAELYRLAAAADELASGFRRRSEGRAGRRRKRGAS